MHTWLLERWVFQTQVLTQLLWTTEDRYSPCIKQQQHPYLLKIFLSPVIVLNSNQFSFWITCFWQIGNKLFLESECDWAVSSMTSKYNSFTEKLEYFMFTARSPWNTKIPMKSQAGLRKSPRHNQFALNSQAISGIALLAPIQRLL